MKKKIRNRTLMILAVLATMTLMIGTVALAEDPAPGEPFYCDMCGNPLSSGYTHVAHFTESHMAQTQYYDQNGNPIYASCTITHDITQKGKYCSVHGLKWVGSHHIEDHSYYECADVDRWE